MADETTKIIRIVIDSSKAVDGSAAATRALAALEAQSLTMNSTLSRVERALDSIGTTVKANLALAVLEVTRHIVAMAKGALEAAGHLEDLSKQIGISTKFLQASQFAAAGSGVAVDDLTQSFEQFSKRMGEAESGSKAIIDTLAKLGIQNLDTQGKLRPTEDLMTDVAVAIGKISDPAKQASAAVELFGRGGQKLLPMLNDIAGGAGAMAQKAQAAGAMMDSTVTKSLKDMADRAEQSSLKFRALFATIGAPIITAALEAVNTLLSSILANLDRLKRQAAQAPVAAAAADQSNLNDQLEAAKQAVARNPNDKLAQSSLTALQARAAAAAGATARAQTMVNQIGYQSDEEKARAGSGALPASLYTGGGSLSTSTDDMKAGESLADKIRKETDALTAAADAQKKMTDAARGGAVAFQDQEAHTTALTKAIEAYGGKLDAADPKVQALADKWTKLIAAQKEGAAAQTFIVGTTDLEKQNDLLTAQIALMNQAPDVQAREIALIKSKQEAEKAGNKLTADDIESRRKAIEQNETLKTQQEQLKAAQELWTEPLKTALRDIQTTAANAFETMLDTGNFSFQSLADAFTKTVKRMAAEFLALATVRPIMSVFVSGLVGGGIISPAMANQVGFPQVGISGSATSGGGMSLGGLGGGGFGGFGGLGGGSFGGGSFGSAFGFLNQPIFPSAGQSAATAAGVSASDYAAIFGNDGGFGGLTYGGALGGLAGIGSGIYSLASGGGSTGSMIGGAAGILGGGLSLLGPMLGLGAAAGPIGMGIGLLGAILPSLFGGDNTPKIPPQPPLVLSGGRFIPANDNTFSLNGYGLNGGTSLQSTAGGLARSLLGSFGTLGLRPVSGSLIGGEVESGVNHTLKGQQWSDSPYTQSTLVRPGGAYQLLTTNDSSRNLQQAGEYTVAQAFKANVLEGGVSGASASLKTALTNFDPQTKQDVDDLNAFIKTFDLFGKAANPAKDAIDKLNATFDDLAQQATTYGLDLTTLDAERTKETKRSAQDFIDNMIDPVAVQLRALDDERKSSLASAQYIKDTVTGVYVDMDKIATYYTNKEATLRDTFYAGSVALIDRLVYGDLSNTSPSTGVKGTKAAYDSALALALSSGDTASVDSFNTVAASYATAGRNYYASGSGYEAIKSQIISDLSAVTGIKTTTSAAATTSTVTNDSLTQLTALTKTQSDQITDLTDQVSSLTATLRMQANARM